MALPHTNVIVSDGDLPAVGLVCDTLDLLEVVGVGKELVASDDVLLESADAVKNAIEYAPTL